MRLSEQATFTTDRSAEEVLNAARDTLSALTMSPRSDSGTTVTGTRGSLLGTAVLGMFAGQGMMPVKVEVQVNDDGSQRVVGITAVENYFTQTYLWMKPRMRGAVQSALASVRDGLQQRLGAGASTA